MRLYLSSFRMGCCPERLLELTRGATNAVVIANATDVYPPSDRSAGVDRELQALQEVGFEATELDLRDYFDADSDRLAARLSACDLVWARGGDVWTLRHTLAASGADQLLRQLLVEDRLVYGGYSAGPCVLAPSLRGLELVDDPAWVKGLYGTEPHWDGLGVLDYAIVPHVNSPDHPETQRCDQLADHYRQTGVAHRCVSDGDVLIIDGVAEQVVTD